MADLTPEERAREALPCNCGSTRRNHTGDCPGYWWPTVASAIRQSRREAVEAEREACAVLMEEYEPADYELAAGIRARGTDNG